MTEKYYPEIYLSSDIEEITSETPPINCGEAPIAPKEPQRPNELQNNEGCGMFAIVSLLITIFCIKFGKKMEGGYPYFIILVCGISSIVFVYCYFKFKSDYEKGLQEYHEKSIEYERAYKEYLIQKEKYDIENAEYLKRREAATKKALETHNVQAYRKSQLEKYKIGKKPQLGTAIVPPKEGLSEQFFSNLCKEFGLYVKRGMIANIRGISYYPDITWEEDGLLFDIEIDEPYTMKEGTPIHHLDKYGMSTDSDRNSRFATSKWNVIRFSEEQICKHPTECVCLLLAIKAALNKGDYDKERILDNYETLKTPKWDEEQSHKWAYHHYREEYLKSINITSPIKSDIISTNHTVEMSFDDDSNEHYNWYEEEDMEIDNTAFLPFEANAVSCLSLKDFQNKHGKISDCHSQLLGIRYLKKENALIPEFGSAGLNPVLRVRPNTIHVEDWTQPIDVYGILDNCYYNTSNISKGLSITNIILNPEMKSLGYACFAGMENLKSINLPDGLLEIKGLAFCRCTSLQKITIPGSVNNIPSHAFSECSNLESIVIKDGVKAIMEYAFESCKSLHSLVIPQSVISFDMTAIEGCSDLQLEIKNPYMKVVYDDPYNTIHPKIVVTVPFGSIDYYSNYFDVNSLHEDAGLDF